jgi:hypothetical protein
VEEAAQMERIGRIRQQERIAQVVSWALISGVATLGTIAYFLVRSNAWQPMNDAMASVILYAGIGVTSVGLLTAPVLGARLRHSLRALPEDEVIQRYASSIIVPQAIREGVGIMGVTAGTLAGASSWILIFAAASVASQVIAFPRTGDLGARLGRSDQ